MTTDPELSLALQEHEHHAGTRWRHFKGGDYEILLIALRESDKSPQVIYRSNATGIVFVRPLAEFMDGRFVPIK